MYGDLGFCIRRFCTHVEMFGTFDPSKFHGALSYQTIQSWYCWYHIPHHSWTSEANQTNQLAKECHKTVQFTVAQFNIHGLYHIMIHVCMYVCLYVCMYVCMYVRTYVRMYVCMYIHTYIWLYIYICMHSFAVKIPITSPWNSNYDPVHPMVPSKAVGKSPAAWTTGAVSRVFHGFPLTSLMSGWFMVMFNQIRFRERKCEDLRRKSEE